MRVIECGIAGVLLFEPDVYRDARGYFLEPYHADKYRAAGLHEVFVQDNHSRSVRRTLRGLHLQVRNPQGKLIRAIAGEIWDVAVDVRPDSPTFGKWVGEVLSGDNFRQLYIPPGFAHGFCVLSDEAHVEYKCTRFYDPADEIGIAYNDPALAIDWPVADPLLSPKDARNPLISQLGDRIKP